jgi:hypothetical protein
MATQPASIQLAATPVTELTNREQVEQSALAIVFATDKTAPLLPVENIASKAGTVSYASIRKHLRTVEPSLTGAALTVRVNQLMGGHDATALATVIQLNREGFKFQRLAGRELKNGTRKVSVTMSNAIDRNDKTKPKTAEDLTVAELEALLAKKREATAPTFDMPEREVTPVEA